MSAMKMGMKKKMSAMKMGMKKMAMKKSIIAKGKQAKSSVFRGTKVKTVGGLKKSDLKRNKNGKVVSVKASNAAKKRKGFGKFMAWINATKAARKALGVRGFRPVGGSSAKGKALLAKTKSLYKK